MWPEVAETETWSSGANLIRFNLQLGMVSKHLELPKREELSHWLKDRQSGEANPTLIARERGEKFNRERAGYGHMLRRETQIARAFVGFIHVSGEESREDWSFCLRLFQFFFHIFLRFQKRDRQGNPNFFFCFWGLSSLGDSLSFFFPSLLW